MTRSRIVAFCLGFAVALPLVAQPAVPEPLGPWVPWVLEGHPDLECPLVAGKRLCAWPGRLALDLDDRGGSFALEVRVDRDMDLLLPGDAAHWPLDVRSDGTAAFMRRAGERPAVGLRRGTHRLAGRFRWSRLPESLPLPPSIALVDLVVRGENVRNPRRETDGLLWLAATRSEEAEQDRLTLGVARRIEDGVPVTLTTRLRLDVTGRSRAVELEAPLLAGFVLTGLQGQLPLRWSGSERLVVQVRPGTWEIYLTGRSSAPVDRLERTERGDPWPAEEVWSFSSDPAVRAVRVSGGSAVDPQRTTLPESWKSLPAYRLGPGDGLDFVELRRGEPQPPPDALHFHRTFWLEQDGERLTARDAVNGQLFQGGRLEALGSAELGRFSYLVEGTSIDELITLDPGDGSARGVEVRQGRFQAQAELSYPRGGAVPAVGWNRDAQSLVGELRLPPGWTLVAAPGVDEARGAWIDRWTLLDFFLLLITSLATWRLDDRRWGALALLFLTAAWHEPHAMSLLGWWLALLPLRALLRFLEEGRVARLLRGLRWLVLVGLSVTLVAFCAEQWRSGLFPQLEKVPRASYETSRARFQGLTDELKAPGSVEEAEDLPASPAPERKRSELYGRGQAQERLRSEEVVQTGSGVPSWWWRTCHLTWNGPVPAGHTMRFWLISPGLELLLSLLRIAAAVVLAVSLIDPRRTAGAVGPSSGGTEDDSAAAAAAVALLLAAVLLPSGPATAEEPPEVPPAGVLAELERRLTAPPPCHPDCVEVPRLVIEARGSQLRLLANVHAAVATAWRLPGPAASWAPSEVRVDGSRTTALRFDDGGFLLLRLDAGVHQVELVGPARNSFSLELPLRPRTLAFQGDGWTLDGWRRDEPPPAAVRLERELAEASPAGEEEAVELPPWLELRRRLNIGPEWRVESELVRRGPSSSAVTVRVPLLTGEAVTTAGIPIEDGEAVVRLEPGETARRFASTLEEAESLELIAPVDRPWLERWELDCSPIWSCRTEGLAPTRHMEDGVWRPLWQPWPGETVKLGFTRPEAAPGKTTTVDQATLRYTPGRRLLEATLELTLRSSRGGEQTIVLPAAAALQSFEVDGTSQVVQDEGGRLVFTLEPGAHRIVASWRQDHGSSPYELMPEVRLGEEAVNVDVVVQVPPNRWLLWAGGPGWGPVVQLWQYLLVLALAAWVLGRWAPTPLRTHDWFLLAAGLTQVPLAAALFVVAWLLSLGLRERLRARHWWSYDFLQLSLFGVMVVGLGVLYAAIHSGLLFQPDMQVLGPGSHGSTLQWYVDRAGETLPQPWVLWLPLWVWRVLMLLWSLWLAARLLRWLPWSWQRLTVGPLLAGPKTFQQAAE